LFAGAEPKRRTHDTSVSQRPWTQLAPVMHRLPQAPQLVGSVPRLRQMFRFGSGSQSVSPCEHPHWPLVHVSPSAHRASHRPQLSSSVARSTQAAPQRDAPPGQAHSPFGQLGSSHAGMKTFPGSQRSNSAPHVTTCCEPSAQTIVLWLHSQVVPASVRVRQQLTQLGHVDLPPPPPRVHRHPLESSTHDQRLQLHSPVEG
jgi:hypothetical protein